MRIKERLRNKKNTDFFVEVKNDSYITEIFNRNSNAEKILYDAILNSKNIIITCGIDCDKSIIKTYIKNFSNAYEPALFDNGATGIFKQYEKCIAGKYGSISIVNIKYFDNILSDLNMLMSIACPNLSQDKINEVLSVVNPIIFHFEKDEDGLFYINHIAYIKMTDSSNRLEDLYSYIPEENNNSILISKENTEEKAEENKAIQSEEISISTQESQVIQEYKIAEEPEEKPQKVNKYKLLRDKFRFRKSKK